MSPLCHSWGANRLAVLFVFITTSCTLIGCGPKKPKVAAAPTTQAVEVASIESESTEGHVHIVQVKDSLYQLAKKYYGNGQEYTKIYEANKNRLGNPNYLPVGMKLIIP